MIIGTWLAWPCYGPKELGKLKSGAQSLMSGVLNLAILAAFLFNFVRCDARDWMLTD